MLFLSPASSCAMQLSPAAHKEAFKKEKKKLLLAVMSCQHVRKERGAQAIFEKLLTAARNTRKAKEEDKQIVQTQDLKSKLQYSMQCDRTAGENDSAHTHSSSAAAAAYRRGRRGGRHKPCRSHRRVYGGIVDHVCMYGMGCIWMYICRFANRPAGGILATFPGTSNQTHDACLQQHQQQKKRQ